MAFKEKIETYDTVLSIVQRLLIILGIIVGAILVFVRLEHTPSTELSAKFVGIDICSAKLELNARNIGRLPFTISDAVLAAGIEKTDFQKSDTALPQKVSAGEVVGIIFDFPVDNAMGNRIIDMKVSIKLAEDSSGTWRVLDKAIKLPEISKSC